MNKDLSLYCSKYGFADTAEKFVSALLSVLTYQSGFHVSKAKLGPCWFEDCCWGLRKYGGRFTFRCAKSVLDSITKYEDRIRLMLVESLLNRSFVDTAGNRYSLYDILDLEDELAEVGSVFE